MEPPQYEPIITMGKLGDNLGGSFLGFFRGSGLPSSHMYSNWQRDCWLKAGPVIHGQGMSQMSHAKRTREAHSQRASSVVGRHYVEFPNAGQPPKKKGQRRM